jgi:hypothetical protein
MVPDAGVVDQDIERAGMLIGPLHEGFDGVWIANIERVRHCRVAAGARFLADARGGLLVDIGDDDPSPGGAEPQCYGPSDTLTGARDEGRATAQREG